MWYLFVKKWFLQTNMQRQRYWLYSFSEWKTIIMKINDYRSMLDKTEFS